MTKCKFTEAILCLFANTLPQNPIISLQSVSCNKIVFEHRHSYNHKKIRDTPTGLAETT